MTTVVPTSEEDAALSVVRFASELARCRCRCRCVGMECDALPNSFLSLKIYMEGNPIAAIEDSSSSVHTKNKRVLSAKFSSASMPPPPPLVSSFTASNGRGRKDNSPRFRLTASTLIRTIYFKSQETKTKCG